MAIKLGSTDISDIRLGDKQVSAVYLGDKLVWQKVQGIRYIRDSSNGSNINNGNHWVEIKAFENGINVALNKHTTGNSVDGNYYKVVNGNTNTEEYLNAGAFPRYVIIDLGAIYSVDKIIIWHYYGDSRTYYRTKTEVSADGVTWKTVWDSAVSGTYIETAQGHTITL